MTGVQLRLLLMVAKDMRRLWEERHFSITYSMQKKRKEEYDEAIYDVEQEAKHERRG